MAKAPAVALRFYGVVDADNVPDIPELRALSVIRSRDLGAVVAPTQYMRTKTGDAELADYTRVIDELYKHGPVIPAPPGTVFRDANTIQSWLELHHAKLHETLGLIESRDNPNPPYDFVRMELGA